MKYFRSTLKLISKLLCVLSTAFVSANAIAYERLGDLHWDPPAAVFHYGMLSNKSYKNAFIKAMESWNGKSAFAYSGDNKYVDPCPYNPINGAGISYCGANFGASTVAVTRSGAWPGGILFEADIAFNPNINWGVHDKPAGSSSALDITRVAVHELGHALGLDHETTKSAIMHPFYGNILVPTTDDINGLLAIYGEQLPPFNISPLILLLLTDPL